MIVLILVYFWRFTICYYILILIFLAAEKALIEELEVNERIESHMERPPEAEIFVEETIGNG